MGETVEVLGERVSVRAQRTRLRMIIAETLVQRKLIDLVNEDLEKGSRNLFHANYPEIENLVASTVIFLTGMAFLYQLLLINIHLGNVCYGSVWARHTDSLCLSHCI